MLSDKKNMAANKTEAVKHISGTAENWTSLKNSLNSLRCKLWIQNSNLRPWEYISKKQQNNHS